MLMMTQRLLPFEKRSAVMDSPSFSTAQVRARETQTKFSMRDTRLPLGTNQSDSWVDPQWFKRIDATRWRISNADDIKVDESSATRLIKLGEDEGVTIDKVQTRDKAGVVYRLRAPDQLYSIDLFFNLSDGTLQLYSKEVVVATFPEEASHAIGVMLASLLLSLVSIMSKRKQSAGSKSKGEEVQKDGDCLRDPRDGTYLSGHDIQCNLPLKGVVTSDGRFYMYVYCLWHVERIEINALDCCKEHDIAMFCAENDWGAVAADLAVVACFTGKIIDQSLGKLNPWCGVFMGGYAQLLVQIAAGFILGALLSFVAFLGHDNDLIGYGGRNRDSCLCGGSVPTKACNDPCLDLCKRAGKKANCGDCKWACDYDKETGIARDYKLLPPKNGKPCCPGTEDRCLPRPSLPLKQNCPDRAKECYDCKWVCEGCSKYDPKFCLNPGVYTPVLEKADDVDCCKGTPRPQQKPGPDWCTAAPRDPDIRGPIVLIPG